MDLKSIAHRLTEKKVKDYTFTILFFLIFSFFLVGVIRPNVLTAFQLQTELVDLKELDKVYESAILQIVDHQTLLENNRDNLYVLGEAVPTSPSIYQIIDTIQKAAKDNNIVLNNMDFSEIPIKTTKQQPGMKSLTVNLRFQDDIKHAEFFFDSLLKQRRLKTLNDVSYTMSSVASESAIMDVNLVVKGYYGL